MLYSSFFIFLFLEKFLHTSFEINSKMLIEETAELRSVLQENYTGEGCGEREEGWNKLFLKERGKEVGLG